MYSGLKRTDPLVSVHEKAYASFLTEDHARGEYVLSHVLFLLFTWASSSIGSILFPSEDLGFDASVEGNYFVKTCILTYPRQHK